MNYLSAYLNNIFYQGMEFFGKYYANYRGYVIDNNDPEKLNRLLVRVPQVTGTNAHSKWAYPKGNFSGKGYGIQVLPRKGDLVWVEFEHGNPAFPLWSHAHYSNSQKPKEFNSVNVFGFKSPGKQMFLIDDDKGKIYLVGGNGEVLGEHEGLVKVIELTEVLNRIENNHNTLLLHYQTHLHSDPLSGQTGPMVQPKPQDLPITDKDYLQNDKILH